jgi:hypothetical protein
MKLFPGPRRRRILPVFFCSLFALATYAERPDAERIKKITKLEKVEALDFPSDISTHHPQGLVKVGDYFYLSTVDKDSKKGFIVKFHINGKTLVKDAEKDVTLADDQYHPGGIDYDAKSGKLVTFVAQYKAKSKATLIRIDPVTLEFIEGQSYSDHLGGVFLEGNGAKLHAFNWDSVESYVLEEAGNPTASFSAKKKTSDKAYQDCKVLGTDGTCAIATGLRKEGLGKNGYLCLIKADANGNLSEEHTIFTQKVTTDGATAGMIDFGCKPLAQNPIETEVVRDAEKKTEQVLFYFVPYDKDESKFLIFEGK